MCPTAVTAHASHLEVGANAGPPAVIAAVGFLAVRAYARHDLAIIAAQSASNAAPTVNALGVDANAFDFVYRRRPSSFLTFHAIHGDKKKCV